MLLCNIQEPRYVTQLGIHYIFLGTYYTLDPEKTKMPLRSLKPAGERERESGSSDHGSNEGMWTKSKESQEGKGILPEWVTNASSEKITIELWEVKIEFEIGEEGNSKNENNLGEENEELHILGRAG